MGLILKGDGTAKYYYSDALGSTRALANDSGTVVASYDYKAFGDMLSSSGSANTYLRYTGQQSDPESGLYYLRARYYDPTTGRFSTKDPWPGNASAPITQNPYVYALNRPTGLADPQGTYPAVVPHPGPATGPPPIPVPGGGPDNGWKWNPDPNNARGGTWGPKKPVKTATGSRPVASWEPDKNNPNEGHWDVNDGSGGPRHYYDKDGKEIPAGQQHNDSIGTAEAVGATVVGAAATVWWFVTTVVPQMIRSAPPVPV